MTIKSQAHYQAITELLELMNLAFLVALFADACWVIRDMAVNGPTLGLGAIAIALWMGFFLVLFGFIKYHRKQVKEILCRMTQEKLEMCKKLQKTKRRHNKKVRAKS